MKQITANEIKTKGISVLDEISKEDEEAVITVRGKQKYVVIPIEKYNRVREYELQAAVDEAKRDIEEGKHYTGIKEHLKRVSDV